MIFMHPHPTAVDIQQVLIVRIKSTGSLYNSGIPRPRTVSFLKWDTGIRTQLNASHTMKKNGYLQVKVPMPRVRVCVYICCPLIVILNQTSHSYMGEHGAFES